MMQRSEVFSFFILRHFVKSYRGKKELVEMDVLEQREIDERLIELDGTENKERMAADSSKKNSLIIL